jgi:hypothetical protein
MPGPHDHSAGRIPFWVHQIVELLLGMLLLLQGARTGEHVVLLVGMGAVLLLLALCSDGALAAWPWIGRRLHRILDLVLAAALAVSPLVLGVSHVLSIVILELAAGAMVWLALRTEWRRPARRPARARPASPAPAPPRSAGPPPATPPAARKLGAAVGKARDDGPRQLGRLVGRAHRAARSAMRSPEDPASGSETPPDAPPAP